MATKLKREKSKPVFSLPKDTEDSLFVPENLGICPEDSILVLQDDALQVSKGGIIIIEDAQTKPDTGTVVAVGQRSDGKEVAQEIGDRLLFGQEAGRNLNLLGKDYLLVRYRDILWTFKK